ncbi:excinuclease ABC subunit UvrC [Gammaproteobacteria bacterium LSUCC0057]|uniref:UvrABC system protein C n=1 Tax=Gammaproteobacteria bacterium LSUCC0057 TaxID=2559237 RepID=A0A4Y8UJB2_9GAMM|nr:excinuclease ABC subunit UvrC [Gammaproteobacteria bacterium LSUCC0057]
MSFDHSAFLASLTERPGVYQMLDSDGVVIYVGKAKNLKRRVASYFRRSGLAPKTRALVARIAAMQVTITETETEALLLENNLIKQYQPNYNVLLRDDKSYPYIFLSDRDQYPRLALHRGPKRQKGAYFGPFPSKYAVRESLGFLQKVFKVRQCDDSFFRNRSRPCLQHQIKRCSAPCVGLISPEQYAADVEKTQLYLQGKSSRLMRSLEQEMERAAESLQFEQAAEFRDQISALRQIQAEQVIEQGIATIDVISAAYAGGSACVHVLFVRQGKVLGSRSYYPKVPLADSVAEVLEQFLPALYLTGDGRPDLPKELIVSDPFEGQQALAEALTALAGRQVALRHQVRAVRSKWLQLAQRTANHNLAAKLASKENMQQRLEALAQELQLDELPNRMECFDISHSSGEAVVASCVVFDGNGPLKSDYRRFNIDGVTAGDDYAAMEQALRRRYARLVNGEGRMPDILFIDGGKGQLGVAQRVLADLGVNDLCLVGVAKGVTRKPGLETLIVADSGREIVRPAQAALHLIQQIRDEAHRFAITGHKQRRDKKRSSSGLQDIPGVGPQRRRDLLKYFGGLQEIKRASVADLMKVANINKKVAEAIYSTFHNQ